MDEKEEPERLPLLWFVLAFCLTALLGLGYGLYSAMTGNLLFRAALAARQITVTSFAEIPNFLGTRPVRFLQPSRSAGSGVTVNEIGDGSLVLLQGFVEGNPGVLLMRRDGTVIRHFPFLHSRHFPDAGFLGSDAPATDWNIDLHGAVMNSDGSLVVTYEYGGTVKLDRCGNTLWALPYKTHHSVDRAASGGYWIPGRTSHWRSDTYSAFPPLTNVRNRDFFFDDQILKVSEDGTIETAVSVVQIFYDSGLDALLTANGINYLPTAFGSDEFVHLNKIAELPSEWAAAFPGFSAGDLLISLRQQNLIAVIDPQTWRVKWHQIGPFRRQHDTEFSGDGTIRLFNNNTYRTALDADDRSIPGSPMVSTILAIDPATHAATVLYGGKPGQEMLSVIRGKVDDLPGGHLLITEFEAGRAFEVDRDGRTVWEYINRYDAEEVAEVTEARVYPADYFTVTDWSCPAN